MRGCFEILVRELKSEGWVIARFMVSDCVANVVKISNHGYNVPRGCGLSDSRIECDSKDEAGDIA